MYSIVKISKFRYKIGYTTTEEIELEDGTMYIMTSTILSSQNLILSDAIEEYERLTNDT